MLIEAMAVRERFPEAVPLLVGGEPRQIERPRRRPATVGVANAARMVGKRPLEEMPEFMALATVLASPRPEPRVTPLKIYTYMASGRPIVATDLTTHTDVLDRATAILVPPTAEGVAQGMIRAFDDPAAGERMGQQARQKVERDHTYEAFREQLRKVYAYLEEQNHRTSRKTLSWRWDLREKAPSPPGRSPETTTQETIRETISNGSA